MYQTAGELPSPLLLEEVSSLCKDGVLPGRSHGGWRHPERLCPDLLMVESGRAAGFQVLRAAKA